MSEQIEEVQQEQLPARISISVQTLQKNLPVMEKGRELALKKLSVITQVTSDEEDQQANDVLVVAKQIADKVIKARKEITEPLDVIKGQLMEYEKAIAYDSKADNEFNRVRHLREAYAQLKIDEKKKKEYEADLLRQIAVYKAMWREKIQKALIEMQAGRKRSVIEGMSAWESSMTLENFETKKKALESKTPELKQEVYDACFHPLVQGRRTDLVRNEEEFLLAMKQEFPYQKQNEEYMAMAVEIINGYRAKLPTIKEKLIEISKQQDAAAAEAKRKEELRLKAEEQMKASQAEAEQKIQSAKDDADLNILEAEFQRQGMVQDLESGPAKRVITFAEGQFLKPFTEIIGHCIAHPDFPGIKDKKGGYVKHVQWWMDWFASHCIVEIKGTVVDLKAKTFVRQ